MSVVATPGSVHMSKINFRSDETVFPPEIIPERAVLAKKEVLGYQTKDVLGLLPPRWESSVSVEDRYPLKIYHRQLFRNTGLNGRMGEFDYRKQRIEKEKEIIVVKKPNKFTFQPPPLASAITTTSSTVKIDNVAKEMERERKWNVSVVDDDHLINKTRANAKRLSMIQERAQRNSQAKEKQLKEYTSPKKRVELLINQQQQQKQKENEMREQLKKIYMGSITLEMELKRQSDRKINQEIEVVRKAAREANRSAYRRNLDTQQADPIVYQHMGAWMTMTAKRKGEEEQEEENENDNKSDGEKEESVKGCWSCCMNEVYISRGCSKLRRKKD